MALLFKLKCQFFFQGLPIRVQPLVKKDKFQLKFSYCKQKFLSFKTKKMFIIALIQCHINYVFSEWYFGTSKFWKNRLQVTQNSVMRFILQLDIRYHIRMKHYQSFSSFKSDTKISQHLIF